MAGKKKKVVGILCAALLVSSIIGMGSIGYGEKGAVAEQESSGNDQVQAQGEGTEEVAVLQTVGTKVGKENVSSNTPEELQAFGLMEQVAENDTLQLYVKRETAEIAVKDKRDGYIWFSNPTGRNEDPKASPLYKSELSTQVLVTYYNDKGQVNAFNSYDDSVAKKQFEILAKENGLKVVYRMGTVAQSYANIPKAISKKRFQERILDKIADSDMKEDVGYKFRLDEEKQIYEVRKLQDYVAEELSATLEASGYTAEDAAQDNKENGAGETAAVANAEFTIPVEYTLDGENLVVSVPNKELKYNKSYPLATLQVLKYFGAADTKKSGYLFVPDGAGALIRLGSDKQNAEPYSLPVYGNDGTYDVKEKIQSNEITRLPVFGLKQNDHALLGIIEDGDAMASVMADVSGRNDSYNSVSSKFQVVAMDFYTLTSGTKTSSVPMFQNKTYEGNLQLRFAFLSGDASDYVGMAEQYRNYLAGKYHLKPLSDSEDAPFILELEGAFRKSKSFLGISYESTESLTSFSEAQTLLQKLKDANIQNIDLRYVGWFNDGIRHSSPSDISIVGALGGKSGFGNLAEYAKQNQIGFYPDVAFLEKYKGDSGAATFLDHGKAKMYEYDPVMYVKDTSKFSHYILSPSVLPKQVEGFIGDYTELGIKGLSLRDLGDEVNSDFDFDKTVSRQNAMQTITAETEKLKKQAGSLMVNGGNAYSLPYADVIVNAPTKSSLMNITDEDIPFYQIALHGYYDLAGSPYNMDEIQNPRMSMLKGLETGSNVYYQWYYSDLTKVKDTDFNHLYALSYKDWFEEAVGLYNEANTVLKKVRNQVIVEHGKPAPGVVQTTFQNGITITINYNNTAVAMNGLQIGAHSYQVGGE